jgi:hypothetical protein
LVGLMRKILVADLFCGAGVRIKMARALVAAALWDMAAD